MKKAKVLLVTMAFMAGMSITSFAGEWKQDTTGWWYQNDDGSFPNNTWKNLDGKTYLFGSDGYMRTGWILTVDGNWYYLNATGEMRLEDLTENDITYHFDSNGRCTNPNGSSSFNNDYQSILDQEKLEAEKRLLNQPSTSGDTYEEEIKYEHDVSSAETQNRFGLADMQF